MISVFLDSVEEDLEKRTRQVPALCYPVKPESDSFSNDFSLALLVAVSFFAF